MTTKPIEDSVDTRDDVDAAWREELVRRVAAIDAGTSRGRPPAEVIAEIRETVERGREPRGA